jgi:hypothetical protein
LKVHSTNYADVLITLSPDSKATLGPVAPKSGSIGAMQYDRLSAAPYAMTSDELIIAVLATRKDIPESDWPAFQAEYFSKGQPCLRVSPLVKTMGWAMHHDSESRVALVDVASARFAALMVDDSIRKIHGMRNKRA